MKKTSFSLPIGESVGELALSRMFELLVPLAAEVEAKMELTGDEVLCWEALHCRLEEKNLLVCKVQLAKSNSFVVGQEGSRDLVLNTCGSIYVFREGGYGQKPGLEYDTSEMLALNIVTQLRKHQN